MQFVGRTLGFSLRRKKDFCATIEGHRQKIKENLTGSGDLLSIAKTKKTKFDSGFPNKKDEIGRDQINPYRVEKMDFIFQATTYSSVDDYMYYDSKVDMFATIDPNIAKKLPEKSLNKYRNYLDKGFVGHEDHSTPTSGRATSSA